MFRFVIIAVVMIISMISSVTSFAETPRFYGVNGDIEFVQSQPTRNGDTVMIMYEIANGPSTDCDRIIIMKEIERFVADGYSVELVRQIRRNLESRGIPIAIYSVVIGNVFHPERDMRYNTAGL